MLVALRKAAAIVPGDPRLYYLQAVLAARAGQFTLARSLLHRTRGQMDGEPGFMLLSAVVELELGGQALSASWSERLLAAQPHNFTARRSEEHTSELQSLMRNAYAVFCLKKK